MTSNYDRYSNNKHNTTIVYNKKTISPYTIPFNEQDELIKLFPSTIKFSYERSTHKKVLSDLYVIIPKGKKYFAWFTHRNRQNVCIFMEVGSHHQIMNMFYRHVSFDDSLSYGTIFYGTLFRTAADMDAGIYDNEIFSVENIHYYKGDNIERYNYEDKLSILRSIFETKLQYNVTFFKKGVIFGLPVIETDFLNACACADKLPYSVYSIQYRYLKNNDTMLNRQDMLEYYIFNKNTNNESRIYDNSVKSTINNFNNTLHNVSSNTITSNKTPVPPVLVKEEQKPKVSNEIFKIFYIKPDIQNDIYYLYNASENMDINSTRFSMISKDIAHIPDYKTSVLMNKLFRNIKENHNLDSLEESDEEEEFENIQIDKFVDLNKILKMRCSFNYKFKKWVPVQVIN
jgi:hypothetical protein